MVLNKKDNYFATVVKINNVFSLKGLDRLGHANFFGNMVLVSKNIEIGTMGLFFPLECQINHEFLKANNLYRNAELNSDVSKKGYFEDSGRVKAQKFQGHKSMGFFVELSSLNYLGLPELPAIGSEFNDIDNKVICKKYRLENQQLSKSAKQSKLAVVQSKLVDNQFRFHYDTAQFGRNLHKIDIEKDYLTITMKIHGTSGVFSNILTKKPLNWLENIAQWLGVKVQDTEYGNIYSSRKVIKNDKINPSGKHYYDVDIWGIVNDYLKQSLPQGCTVYCEIVGYLPDGRMIQKDYDYSCVQPKINEQYVVGKHCKVYVYRVTFTMPNGYVVELNAKDVQVWCVNNGLEAVPLLWYGLAKELGNTPEDVYKFLEIKYLEKSCTMCVNEVPAEGIVIRIDNEAYKMKSWAFYQRETKELDAGIVNLEDNQEEG